MIERILHILEEEHKVMKEEGEAIEGLKPTTDKEHAIKELRTKLLYRKISFILAFETQLNVEKIEIKKYNIPLKYQYD